MTNRIQYTDYCQPETKDQEMEWLKAFLEATGQPLTIEKAQAALGELLDKAPDAWLLRVEDVPALWVEVKKAA